MGKHFNLVFVYHTYSLQIWYQRKSIPFTTSPLNLLYILGVPPKCESTISQRLDWSGPLWQVFSSPTALLEPMICLLLLWNTKDDTLQSNAYCLSQNSLLTPEPWPVSYYWAKMDTIIGRETLKNILDFPSLYTRIKLSKRTFQYC